MSDPDIDVIEVVLPGPPGAATPGIPGGGFTMRLRPDLSSIAAPTAQGNGQVRFNNSVPASATTIWIADRDVAGVSIDALHNEVLLAGGSGNRGVLRIVANNDSNRWLTWRVTDIVDAGDHWTYTVVPRSGPGGLVHDENVVGMFSETGLPGSASTEAIDAANRAEAAAAAAEASAAQAADTVGGATDEALDLANTAVFAAQAAANEAVNAFGLNVAHSASSIASGTGSKTFTVEAGKNFPATQFVIAVSNAQPATWMLGQVTSYSGSTLVVNVTDIGPTAGTRNDWTITWTSPRGPQGTAGVAGSAGPAGPAGSAGPAGPAGAAGLDAGNRWRFNTSTAADPGANFWRFDNASFSAATKVAFSETDVDNNNVGGLLQALDDSTSANKCLVIMRKRGGTSFFSFLLASNVTDNGTWDEFNIIPIASSGTVAFGDEFYMWVGLIGQKGDTGPSGAGTGDMLKALNLSDVADKKASQDNISIRGADIASAATVNLEAATGGLVDVTGTATITAITLADGHERVARFTGALTLTNGANLVLPGGANITTAAGDFAVFRGYAAGLVRCVAYQRADGHPLITAAASIAPAATTDLGSSPAQIITLTGAASITSFGSSAPIGAVKFVQAGVSGITLVNSGNLVCPGGEDIGCNASDWFIVRHGGGGAWRIIVYSRLNGRPLTTKFDSLASAATTDLGTKLARSLSITGTATITSFGSSAPAGDLKALAFVSAGCVLTNSATLIVPGGANITTLAGDTALVQHEGSGTWRVLSYTFNRAQGAPQRTVLGVGSGTYTTPAGALYLEVEGVGGGGGGAGSGTSVGGNGTAGAVTTFGAALLTGNGGAGGLSNGPTSNGGTASGGDLNFTGQPGMSSNNVGPNFWGGLGGGTFFGPGGATVPTAAGSPGVFPGGGGGGGSTSVSAMQGAGGAGGGYFRRLISPPAASYPYAVGAKGTKGAAGPSGAAGGDGADGIIIVTAYFR